MKISEVMNDSFNSISAAHDSFRVGDDHIVGTGFDDLDLALDGGLEKGSLYLLKGRPESGKTNLAVNLVCNVAEKGYKAAIFSLQEENEMIAQKMLSYKSGVPY